MAADHRGKEEPGMTSAEQRLMRFSLAAIWLVTGFLCIYVYPERDSMALLARAGFSGSAGEAALYGGALLDIVLGVFTLFGRGRWLWAAQALLILIYTFIITIRLPEFWMHPFGPVLKNIPILTLLWLLYKKEERAA